MQKRKLGKQQSGSIGHRTRLHGNELFLRPAQRQAGDDRSSARQPSSAASRSSTPLKSMARSRTKSCVGEALAPVREQVMIATKFGFNLDPDGKPRRRA